MLSNKVRPKTRFYENKVTSSFSNLLTSFSIEDSSGDAGLGSVLKIFRSGGIIFKLGDQIDNKIQQVDTLEIGQYPLSLTNSILCISASIIFQPLGNSLTLPKTHGLRLCSLAISPASLPPHSEMHCTSAVSFYSSHLIEAYLW